MVDGRLANEDKDSMTMSLERIISAGDAKLFNQATETSVAFLSEVGFNAAYFDHQTYLNALDKMSEIGVKGVMVDGALIACTAVEFTNSEDVHYYQTNDNIPERMKSHFKEREEVDLTEISNRLRYHQLAFRGLERLDQHLEEMRVKLPEAKIYLKMHDDDFALTVKQLLHQELMGKRKSHQGLLKRLKDDIKGVEGIVTGYEAEFDKKKQMVEEGKEKLVAGEKISYDIPETRKEREKWRSRLRRGRNKLDQLYGQKIAAEEILQTLLKPNKATPIYQQTQREVVDWLEGYYKEIGEKHGVDVLTRGKVLDFDGFRVDYAHNRRLGKGVVKNREQAILREVQGRARRLKNIDAYIESGHHGKAFKSTVKLNYDRQEWNHENVGNPDPKNSDRYLFVGAVLTFERKDLIMPYLIQGEKDTELAGGEATSTKSHEVVKRHNNGARTGLTILTKRSDGMVQSRWIGMRRFWDKEKYPERTELRSVWAYSDQHVNSDEANEMMVRGFIDLYKQCLTSEENIHGLPSKAVGMTAIGDHSEANSESWAHRYGPNISADEAMNRSVKGIVRLARLAMKVESGKASEDELLGTMYSSLLLQGRLTKSGGTSGENMRATLKRTAHEYLDIIKFTRKNSELKQLFVAVTGNHADGPLKKVGFNELSTLQDMLEGINQMTATTGLEVPYFEMGEANPFEDPKYEEARVLGGGISSFRGVRSDSYGLGINGEDLFGGYFNDEGEFRHLRVNWQHDPKGSNGTGLEGVMENNEADYAFQGHVHFDYLIPVEVIEGELQFRHMLGTTQGPGPTEKYYGKSLPRTQVAYRLVLEKDDYTELAMPGPVLQKFGRAELASRLKEEWEKMDT